MKKSRILGVLALQALALTAVAGEWPPGGGEKFVQECVTNASRQVPPPQAQAYCTCSSGMMTEAFTSQQLEAVTKGSKPTQEELTVLTDISRSCAQETLK